MRNSMPGLLDIMTKVLFFKLKNMKRAKESIKKSHHSNAIPKQPFTPNRASYYYPSTAEAKLPSSPSIPMASDIQFSIDPPRKSKRSRAKTKNKSTKKLVNSSIANLCIHSDHLKKAKITSIAAADIIIEVSPKNSLELNDFVVVSELKLSPILADKQRCIKRPAKRSPVGLHRLRMHACSSPKLSSKKVPVQKGQKSSGSPTRARKKLSESFAVVISSANPEKDFRESMVEMIVENNIRASKDLEELLASYLTLNSNEYHAAIIKVFQQIWFDLSDIITL